MTEVKTKEPVEELKAKAERAEARIEAQPVKPVTAPKPVRDYRALVFQTYAVAATLVFAVLAVGAHAVPFFAIDLTIARAVQSIHFLPFDILMRFISALGFAPQVTIISVLVPLLLYVSGVRWEAVMSFFAVAGVSLLGGLVKIIVDRPRPAADLVHVIQHLNDYSFPSGHVLFYTAFVGFLWFLAYTLLVRSWQRTLALIIFGGLIALSGVSRVYLGQHWPSDALGAYLLGSAWLVLTIYVYRWGKPRFFVRQPVAPEKPPASPEKPNAPQRSK